MPRTKLNPQTNGHKPVDEKTQAQIEETLKEANQSATGEEQTQAPKQSPKQQKGDLAKGSDRLDEKLSDAAQKLVEIDKKAQQVNVQSGLKEGISEVKEWRKAKQLGTLIAMGKARAEDAQEFANQLEKLRQYSDSQLGDEINAILEQLEDETDPLDQLDKLTQGLLDPNPQKSKEAFQILGSDLSLG